MRHPSNWLFHAEALEPRLLLSSGYALSADTSVIPAPDGIDPTALIIDRNGNLFGATAQGGTWNDGTVFEIPNGTSTIETLASLDGNTTGSRPTSLTLDPNGDLFGATDQFDSTPTYGTVFEVRAGSGTATLVANLAQGPGGYEPVGAPIFYNGNLYGAGTEEAVFNGGTVMSNEGVVFELNPNTGAFANLASFSSTSGIDPYRGLVLGPDGNLVGESITNPSGSPATVFKVSTTTCALTTLAAFDTGETPVSNLAVDAAGDIFGATQVASTTFSGRIFEIPQGAGAIETVISTGYSGYYHATQLVGSLTVDEAGNLYGTQPGIFFEVPRGADATTTVVSFGTRFDGTVGQPSFGPLLGPGGDIFGATSYGGTDYQGSIFRVTGGATVTLANFTDPGPSQPSGPLVSDPTGNLFGTTSGGGADQDGTIFEVAQGSTTITVIAAFDGTDGTGPAGALAMDASGDLFGTAGRTVYELPHDSTTITALADVPRLESGLAIDADGDLFGVIGETTTVTSSGKIVPVLPASVFEISHVTGALSTVVQFGRGIAAGGISLDSAGDIFGTFSHPGSNNWTIFDIAPGAHTANPLAVFTPNATPGPLAIDSAGDLFGTITNLRMTDVLDVSSGAIFELAHGASQVKRIAYVRDYNASGLEEPLVVDADGNVFGATSGADPDTQTNGPGTVFEIPKGSGGLTTLLAFNGTNGRGPLGVSLDPNGNLVGTTSEGGTSDGGTFFKLSPAQVASSGPTKLAISSLPSTPIAGVPLNPTVTVRILDSAGQVVTTDNSTVTLTLSGKSDATTTATAVNGVATFSNLVITDPSPAVFLDVSDGTLTAGTELIVSQPFQLVPRLGIVRFPAGALAGSNVDVNAPLAITNSGKPFANPVQIDLYANAAGDLDGNEVLIRSYSVPISLGAGGAMTLSLPIRSLPPALPAGTYHLLALLTEPDTVASLAASPQTVTLAEPFIQPSLSVGAVSAATLTAGEVATVSVTVINNGNVAARGIDLMLGASSDGVTPIPDGLLDSIQSTARIAPGHSKTFWLRFKVPRNMAAGTYYPYVSCLLGGVTTASVASAPFTVAS